MPHPCEVHAQFELREQVEDDAPLVVQDTQVLLFVILRIRHLFSGADVFQPLLALWNKKKKENVTFSAFQAKWKDLIYDEGGAPLNEFQINLRGCKKFDCSVFLIVNKYHENTR